MIEETNEMPPQDAADKEASGGRRPSPCCVSSDDVRMDDEEFDPEAWCDTCGNLGTINCRCGGDICCCENQGEMECPDCQW